MRLSICIPTHNGRAGTLREAIDSVLQQLDGVADVEVCVSDNASQDGTRAMIEEYIAQGAPIVYHRSEINRGFPYNILHLVEMARGQYCWFLGSDDCIVPGGIAQVLGLLDEFANPPGLTVWRRNFDAKMLEDVGPETIAMLPRDPEQAHVYRSAHDIFLNCAIAQTFISTQIFQREKWLEVVRERGFEKVESYGYYPHLYVLGAMALKYEHWVWAPAQLVKNRTDNDASLIHNDNKWHQHILMTMHGLVLVWGDLLGRRSTLYKTLMTKYAEFSWSRDMVYGMKQQHNYKTRDEWALMRAYVQYLRVVSGFWRCYFPPLLVPHVWIKTKLRLKTALGVHWPALKKLLGR